MNYSPHKLYKITPASVTEDENGNPVAGSGSEVYIGDCRCDDFDVKYLKGQGFAYQFTYRVIAERVGVKEGDVVRIMDGENIRGEGIVRRIKQTNYLNYSELWLSK